MPKSQGSAEAPATPLLPPSQQLYELSPSTICHAEHAGGAFGDSGEVVPPPCFMELITTMAEQSLSFSESKLIFFHRANMLMQDTVEAACMCIQSQIEPDLLAKHLLGSEQALQLTDVNAGAAGTSLSHKGKASTSSIADWARVVVDHVGEAYALALGAILKTLCERLVEAIVQQIQQSLSARLTLAIQTEGRGRSQPASAGCVHEAELLPIDRALSACAQLRQSCAAIELLRTAAREGEPNHEWAIPHFSSLGHAKLCSPTFELHGRRWALLFHPRGCGASAQGTHLSAYLRLESGAACSARVRLAVANHRAPALAAFNKPWQWRFETNGKNRGMSSLLPLSHVNEEAGYVDDDTIVLQLWLRPLGAAEARCLPPGQEGGLPRDDMLQAAARRYFHCKLLSAVWSGAPEQALQLLLQLAPSSASSDGAWATERHRLQLLALNAAAADGRKETLAALLEAGALYPVQLLLRGLPEAFSQYSGPYYRVEHPPERCYSFGRPVYRAGGCWLFFAEDFGAEGPEGRKAKEGAAAPAAQWIVGREEDIGRTHGWMYSDDEASSPDLIRGEWQLWQGPLEGAPHPDSVDPCSCDGGSWRRCEPAHVELGAPFIATQHSLTPLHYAAWGGQLECTNMVLKLCKPYAPNPRSPRAGAASSTPEPDFDTPLLLAAQGTTGAAPVVQLLVSEGFSDYRALGQAATHTVRIGLLEAALLQHSEFMALVQDPFAQLSRAVQQFPKPLGAALSNLLGWFSCSLYRDGSTVGPFGSLSAQCQEAVLWRVAEAVLMPPGSAGSASAPLHLCALNESCLWEWLAQWDLMMRMSDKLESLLSEGLDGSDAATEGVYRNLALRYAAQLEECCQLLYGDEVTAELGIQSDGLSVERWSCGGQFLVDVIGRWVFGPSFWIKEHLWRLPDGPSRWEAYRGYHSQLHGTELLLPASYMSIDPWLLSLSCFRGSSAASGRESSMIRYCLELMQSHARHLEGNETDEQSKSGKSRAEMSLSEAWKARCPYINALDLKRGKNRPLYSYMSSVITEGLSAEASPPPTLPTAQERAAISRRNVADLVAWMRDLRPEKRHAVLSFPVVELERLVWVSPIWEVLLNKLPDIIGSSAASKRISCVHGMVNLGAGLLRDPEAAVRAMQLARASEHEWSAPCTPGEALEREKLHMAETLALGIMYERLTAAHKRESLSEDAERMAQLLIEEEEESKVRQQSRAKKKSKKKKKKGRAKDSEEADEGNEEEEDAELPSADAAQSQSRAPAAAPSAACAAKRAVATGAADAPVSQPEKVSASAAAHAPASAAVVAPASGDADSTSNHANASNHCTSTAEKSHGAITKQSRAAAPASSKKHGSSGNGLAPAAAATPAASDCSSSCCAASASRAGADELELEIPSEAEYYATSLSGSHSRSESPLGASVAETGAAEASAAEASAAEASAAAEAGGSWTVASRAHAKGRAVDGVDKGRAVDKEVVERLRDMTGATTARCEEALRLHNGNADSAGLWLLLEDAEQSVKNGDKLGESVAPAAGRRPQTPTKASSSSQTLKPSPAAKASRGPSSPATAHSVHHGPAAPSASSSHPSPAAVHAASVAASNVAAVPASAPTIPLRADRAPFGGAELLGVVRDTPPGKPYGFISMWHQNVTLFYHFNDVLPAARDTVKRHTPVAFQIASWSHGFKAERVRPLTQSEQRVGQKETRMELLSATVTRWSAAEESGALELANQPCTLPFAPHAQLAKRVSLGVKLVCKIEGKGKELFAVHLQLPPLSAAAGRESPRKAATAATVASAPAASEDSGAGARRGSSVGADKLVASAAPAAARKSADEASADGTPMPAPWSPKPRCPAPASSCATGPAALAASAAKAAARLPPAVAHGASPSPAKAPPPAAAKAAAATRAPAAHGSEAEVRGGDATFAGHVWQLQPAKRPKRVEHLKTLYAQWAGSPVSDVAAILPHLKARGGVSFGADGRIDWKDDAKPSPSPDASLSIAAPAAATAATLVETPALKPAAAPAAVPAAAHTTAPALAPAASPSFSPAVTSSVPASFAAAAPPTGKAPSRASSAMASAAASAAVTPVVSPRPPAASAPPATAGQPALPGLIPANLAAVPRADGRRGTPPRVPTDSDADTLNGKSQPQVEAAQAAPTAELAWPMLPAELQDAMPTAQGVRVALPPRLPRAEPLPLADASVWGGPTSIFAPVGMGNGSSISWGAIFAPFSKTRVGAPANGAIPGASQAAVFSTQPAVFNPQGGGCTQQGGFACTSPGCSHVPAGGTAPPRPPLLPFATEGWGQPLDPPSQWGVAAPLSTPAAAPKAPGGRYSLF